MVNPSTRPACRARISSLATYVPPKVLTYTEGNFGARGGGMARDAPQRVLVALQWVVLVAGVVQPA